MGRRREPPPPEMVAACDRVLPWTTLLALVGGALYLARDGLPAAAREALAEGAAGAPAFVAGLLIFIRVRWASDARGAAPTPGAAARAERAARMWDLAPLLERGVASVGGRTSVVTGRLGDLELELRSTLAPGAGATWRIGFRCPWSGVVVLDRDGQLAARGAAPPPLDGPHGEALLPLLRDHGVGSLTIDAAGLVAEQRESSATFERVPTRSLLGRLRAVALALGAPGAPDAPDVRVTARASQGGDCPYCRSAISAAERVACDACGTAHHAECLADHGGCTVLACAGRPRGAAERAR